MILRSRLVRTFLGASNRKRAPHPFTGFDPSDDPPLAKLRRQDGLQRPYPLINTTLNLIGGKELVRRRCHLIVAVDTSAVGRLDFADLGNAIRKCYIDPGIEIDIDVCNIDVNKDGFSSERCVPGKILYGKADADAPDGMLLYINPSLSGKELADVLNHRKADPDFPHQTRFGQWFGETRFESYRALGYRIGCAALGEAASAARQSVTTCPQQSTTVNEQLPISSFCASLLQQWERPQKPV